MVMVQPDPERPNGSDGAAAGSKLSDITDGSTGIPGKAWRNKETAPSLDVFVRRAIVAQRVQVLNV